MGKDGMVVVAIITDDVADTSWTMMMLRTVPWIVKKNCKNDSLLIDDRLIHEEYHQGARVKNPADGYPLYITYAFAERLHYNLLSHTRAIIRN